MSSNSSTPLPSPCRRADWAVIFDMDGVLTDTARLHYESWLRLAGEVGLPFDEPRYDEMRGLAREESLARFLGDAAGRFSAERQREMIERKQQLFVEAAERLTRDDVFPGVRPLIAELRAAGVPLAVGSSSRNTELVLRRIELREEFEAVVDANDVPRSKPDPAIFLECARRLATPPARCVVIEDAASGIEAARRAGMKAIGVGPRERVRGADLAVSNLEGVKADQIALMASDQPESRRRD